MSFRNEHLKDLSWSILHKIIFLEKTLSSFIKEINTCHFPVYLPQVCDKPRQASNV